MSKQMSSGPRSASIGSDAQNFVQMIAACRFRYVNDDINEVNFPATGPSADLASMQGFSQKDLGGQDMTRLEIEAAIDRKGYRPATLLELLAYAKAEWNGRDWVVALGSSWVDRHLGESFVPFVHGVGDDGRGLDLVWDNLQAKVDERFLFLLVRK